MGKEAHPETEEYKKHMTGNPQNPRESNASKKKVFFLTLEQLKKKKSNLEAKLQTLMGKSQKKKRINLYKILSKVNKALDDPDEYLRDPNKGKMRNDIDRMRRITKKIEKKKNILLEKRRERNATRKVQCIMCNKFGHSVNECTELDGKHTEMCYNCGSYDHRLRDCPKERSGTHLEFAVCFICKETGHLSKDCKDNDNGIFFRGGGCYFCGANDHKRIDCSKFKNMIKEKRNRKNDEIQEENRDGNLEIL